LKKKATLSDLPQIEKKAVEILNSKNPGERAFFTLINI
jgi:hypothetical protein